MVGFNFSGDYSSGFVRQSRGGVIKMTHYCEFCRDGGQKVKAEKVRYNWRKEKMYLCSACATRWEDEMDKYSKRKDINYVR